MKLKIENEIVRRNIEIFKIIMKRAAHRAEELNPAQRKLSYHVFIHRSKGEIRFLEEESGVAHNKEWQRAVFQFTLPSDKSCGFMCEIEGIEKDSFSWRDLKPEALSVLKETIKTVQFIGRFLPKLSSLPAVLHEFSQVNLDSFLDVLGTRDIIHEAWHQVDRVECERLLLSQSSGTFLFRKDEFASILEQELINAWKTQIKCITLSYIDSVQKVSDLTLVKKKEGWLFYNDDPNLEGPLYPSVNLLLDSLKGLLKTPLLHVH
jgi:hypothetical protein